MTNQWVFRKSNNQILRGGDHEQEYDSALEGAINVVEGTRPSPRLHRHDGIGGLREATPQEVAAYDSAQNDAISAREIDDLKAIKAAVLCSLWGRLGRQPTGAEIAAERSRFIAIYKTL